MNATTSYELLCGDCAQVMAEMEPESVDMVMTSPPYDDVRQYKGFSLDIDAVIDGVIRVLRPGGVCVWVVADGLADGSETGTSFRTALAFMEHGMLLHDTMIYAKKNWMPNPRSDLVRYAQAFEYMFCFSKGKPAKFNPILVGNSTYGLTRTATFRNHGKDERERKTWTTTSPTKVHGNIFSYSVGFGATSSYKDAYEHPAVYPERLAYDQISTWTDIGDTVLDPFCGSGTTLFCAGILGRNAIGIDISQEYLDLTRRRLEHQKLPSWALEAGAVAKAPSRSQMEFSFGEE